jgi:S-adenosylmethionine-dependent methyltransferase
MMSKDVYFDGRTDRLRKNIYSTAKGILRIRLVQDDLKSTLPADRELRVLDVGGGLGQMSIMLAEQGHQVTYCEPSAEMREAACKAFEEAGLSAQIQVLSEPVQSLIEQGQGVYDLVLLHAVLEWLARPEEALRGVPHLMAPGGYLSLMYFNLHSIVLRNLLRGNFRKVLSGDYAGEAGGLTPLNPLDPDNIRQWLDDEGMEILLETGIRSFSDYLPREIAQQRSLEELYDLERDFSRREPYRSMARYIHVIAQIPG